MRFRLLAALLATVAAPLLAQPARPALAEPSLSADGRTIAFVSGGDIWEVPAAGGVAHLLVTDAATEGRPRYSPDGTRLAFTSTRGGAANIYVLTLATGQVSRLTWAEANEELSGWSADGKWLYFGSTVNDIGYSGDVFRVAATGGTPLEVSRELFLNEFHGSPSPDGTTLAVMARGISDGQWWRNGHSHIDETELWTRPIADGVGGDVGGGGPGYRKLLGDGAKHAWPLWSADGATLYFMSDRDGHENLWSVPAAGGTAIQLTRFTNGRLLFPSIGGASASNAAGNAIVFERDFGVWRFDPATGQAAAVPITLRGAPASAGQRHLNLTSYDELAVAPDGQKLALIGHGEVFAVAAKDGGVAQRITATPAAESDAAWSADSRRLAFVSQRGLDRILVQYDVATGRSTDLTRGGFVSGPVFAPKGDAIVYTAGKDELRIATPAAPGRSASDRLLYKSDRLATDWNDATPTWSPDGKYIAFPVIDAKSFSNVWVVPAAGGTAQPISFLANGNLGKIAWSADGKYMLFDTSQRSETSRIVRIDLLPHVPRYREDAFRELFKPGPPGDPKPAPTKPDEPATQAAPPPAKPLVGARRRGAKPMPAVGQPATTIVFDGIRERATFLPIGLNAFAPTIAGDGKTLVFLAHDRDQDNLYRYDLDELADEPPVAKQLTSSSKPKAGFALAGDGKTLFYLDGGTPMATPLEAGKAKPVAVQADLDVEFDVEKQIVFDDAWQTLNRNFYDPKFHGQDWTALRARFAPYVAGAKTPAELRRITSLMIGELNASHSGISGPRAGPGAFARDRVGSLGLRFDRAAYEAGRGLIIRDVTTLGPAAVAGGIARGDRLVSVDGIAIAADTNLDRLLENKVGRRIVLGIATPGGATREVVVQPVTVATEQGLHYRQWVADRRALVDRLSGGRLGYVHIADMGDESLQQLYIDLDAINQAKQGVVIDIRENNGGYVNGYALDVLTRRNFLTLTPRGLPAFPSRQVLGQRALGLPTVLVTNESALSDAEDFTEGYRTLGVGKVVGQPTAGWIIYTSGQPLIDGSTVRVPQIRVEDSRGQNMEMNPRPVDIAVERPLGETATGADAQLAAAVRVLLGP